MVKFLEEPSRPVQCPPTNETLCFVDEQISRRDWRNRGRRDNASRSIFGRRALPGSQSSRGSGKWAAQLRVTGVCRRESRSHFVKSKYWVKNLTERSSFRYRELATTSRNDWTFSSLDQLLQMRKKPLREDLCRWSTWRRISIEYSHGLSTTWSRARNPPSTCGTPSNETSNHFMYLSRNRHKNPNNLLICLEQSSKIVKRHLKMGHRLKDNDKKILRNMYRSVKCCIEVSVYSSASAPDPDPSTSAERMKRSGAEVTSNPDPSPDASSTSRTTRRSCSSSASPDPEPSWKIEDDKVQVERSNSRFPWCSSRPSRCCHCWKRRGRVGPSAAARQERFRRRGRCWTRRRRRREEREGWADAWCEEGWVWNDTLIRCDKQLSHQWLAGGALRGWIEEGNGEKIQYIHTKGARRKKEKVSK